ncbi:hypothetical protein BGZ67_003955 [Mortierella alpina]|nr:hypothetical protein BGZ67_003955 [Mortierella alpina]
MRSDGSLMVESDSEWGDEAADEIDNESGDKAEEDGEASSETEEDTEQQLPIQDKEQKVLLGRGGRVPTTQNQLPPPKPPAQEIRRRQPREQPRPLEQQREEQQEKQEQLPPRAKKPQEIKDSIQREVAKDQECVVRKSGHSLLLKLEIMRRKLDARKIQDQTELALAREKLDLEEKMLVLERRRLELQIRDHTRRLAEIQAYKEKFGGVLADFEEKYCFVNETVARADALMDRALRR